MHAAFGLEVAVGVLAFDENRRRLDAGLLARMMVDHLDLEAVPLAPARVHAQQHLGPVLALGAAGAGIDLDIAAVGVRLAREKRGDLVALGALGEFAEAADGVVGQSGVALDSRRAP